MTENYLNKTRILWVGKPKTSQSFIPSLEEKGCQINLVESGKNARDYLSSNSLPDLIMLDAAAMRTSGSRICGSLKTAYPETPLILINSKDYLPAHPGPADVQLTLPFTMRKLINRILLYAPGKSDETFEADPIFLDVERQIIRCCDNEEHVTPTMAKLLKMLINNKGEVVDRETLYSEIWDTEYTQDTRSLDVHISWLRNIIEQDPRDPELLLSVRGVGYTLDL